MAKKVEGSGGRKKKREAPGRKGDRKGCGCE